MVYNTCENKVFQNYEDGKEMGFAMICLGTRLENILCSLFMLVYTAAVMKLY